MKRPLFLDKLSDRQKLLILSLAVGITCGLAAVALTFMIHTIADWVQNIFPQGIKWSYLVTPGLGMLIALLLVRYVVKDNIGHGVTRALVAISKNESRIKPHNMWSSLLTSAVTIGMGGSVGAEAPIVYTGAAIGSNFARYMGMSYKNMTILIGCGAAGALAGIFKAPLAGVLFTLEVLLFNISLSSMFPLLLSSVSATVIAYIFNGQTQPFACTLVPFSMGNIPFYILMGVVCAFASLYFSRVTLWLEDKLGDMSNPYKKWALCAVSLGVLILLFPPLYGEGYSYISMLLNGGTVQIEGETILSFLLESNWGIPIFFLLVLLTKVIAMTMTNSGGGVGGTFGPTLFVGAITGFVLSRSLNLLLAGTGISVPEQNFVLVGMAGLMAGVMQAPMTAIFLIAEVSSGYELFLPLIITATISFGVTRVFEKYSIYTKRIAKTGELLTHDNDQAVLTLMKTSELIRDKYPRVRQTDTLGQVVSVISDSTAVVLAVVDEGDVFRGIIDLDKIHKLMFRTDLYDTVRVSDFMEVPLDTVSPEENMESVLNKFDKSETWRLPVVNVDGKYLGFVSKSRILMAYRTSLKELSTD